MIANTEAEPRSQISALVFTDWNRGDLNEQDVEVSVQKIEHLILHNPELLERSPRFAENSKTVIAKLRSIANDKSKRKLDELSKFIGTIYDKDHDHISFNNFLTTLKTSCENRDKESLVKCFNFLKRKSSSSNPRQKPSKWLKAHLERYSENSQAIKDLLIGSCIIRDHSCRDVCLQFIRESSQTTLLTELQSITLCVSVTPLEKDCFYLRINKDLLSSFSRYFDKMFNQANMRESRNKLIPIIDQSPKEFINMIQSISSGDLQITQDNYQIYLKQSDQYEFPHLKETVEKWIINNLDFSSRDMEHFKIALAISDDFQANRLKGTVVVEVVKNVFEQNDHTKPLVPQICAMLSEYGPFVTNINLSGCFNKHGTSNPVTEVGLHAVFQFLNNVTVLNLSTNNTLTDTALAVILKNLPKLQSLDLEWCCNLSTNGFSSLSSLTNLTSLNLNYCTNFQDSCFDSVIRLPQLRTLNLSRCSQLTDRGVSMAARHLTSMQHLTLDNCKNLSDRSLVSWVKHATKLRELNLINCRITNIGLQIIGKFSTKLRCLSLTLSTKVTPDEVVLMASNLTKLKSLRLKCPPHTLATPNMGSMQRLAQVNSILELVHTPGSPQRSESSSRI